MKNRAQRIVTASIVSIVGNLLLAAIKIVAGLLSGSIAVLSDGVDSASDVVISIIMLITARIMNHPPNERYVYGYHKAESVATKLLSFVIFYAGLQMFFTAISEILYPKDRILPDSIVVYVIIISIFAKLLLSIYQTRVGKRLNSPMLIANGINMRNDIFVSIGVLVGLVFTFIFNKPIIDSITALIVSVVIIRSAVIIFKNSSLQLMDGVKDFEIYDKIFLAVSQVPGAHNPHRVRSRLIGTLHSIVLDIEVDDSLTVCEGHNIATAVEEKIKDAIPEIFDIIVHVEPLGNSSSNEVFGVSQKSKTD